MSSLLCLQTLKVNIGVGDRMLKRFFQDHIFSGNPYFTTKILIKSPGIQLVTNSTLAKH